MEVINPFLQENKQCIIAFLDEISASSLIIILYAMFFAVPLLFFLFYYLSVHMLDPGLINCRAGSLQVRQCGVDFINDCCLKLRRVELLMELRLFVPRWTRYPCGAQRKTVSQVLQLCGSTQILPTLPSPSSP